MLFESLGHLLGCSRHISKRRLSSNWNSKIEFDDGGVLVIQLNPPSQQTVVDWGDCSRAGPSVIVNPFRFYKNILQIWRPISIRLLWTNSQLLPFGLAWCKTRPHHVCSHLWVLNVREWFLLLGSSSFGWVWSHWQSAKNWRFTYLKAAIAIREYCWDDLLAVISRDNLMNALLPCQVVPQVHWENVSGTSLEPLGVGPLGFICLEDMSF